MAGVHEVLLTTDKVQVLEAVKNVQIKTGLMSQLTSESPRCLPIET